MGRAARARTGQRCSSSERVESPHTHAGHKYEAPELGGFLLPEVGVEPTRPKGPRDFESRASANSATLAICAILHRVAAGVHRFPDT